MGPWMGFEPQLWQHLNQICDNRRRLKWSFTCRSTLNIDCDIISSPPINNLAVPSPPPLKYINFIWGVFMSKISWLFLCHYIWLRYAQYLWLCLYAYGIRKFVIHFTKGYYNAVCTISYSYITLMVTWSCSKCCCTLRPWLWNYWYYGRWLHCTLLFASSASSCCKHDTGAHSRLNAETLKRAPTPLFDR